MTAITIAQPRELAHVLQFTADEEARPRLGAVYFSAEDRAMIGTNGHVLARYTRAHDSERDLALYIPRAAEDVIRQAPLARLEPAGEGLYRLDCGGDVWYRCRVMSADWPIIFAQVFPQGQPVAMDHININPAYLALFGDGERLPIFTFYGEGAKPIKVQWKYEPRFTGLVMPIREDA